MNRFLALLSATSAGLVLSCGSVAANDHGDQPKQAMFKTRAEAEAAAPGFGCRGAHPMGAMWMVCNHHTTEQAPH
ncbi:MAG: DUF3721 domain-containing protein [Synechococcus sp.]